METQRQSPNLQDLVKGNTVHLDSYSNGTFYFHLKVASDDKEELYQFSVPMKELGNSSIKTNDRAIYYKRWINRAIEDGTLTRMKYA